MAINAQVLQGKWNTLRGHVKEHWGRLTDDDLQFSDGNIDRLIGRIQQKTGEGREAIERYLADLSEKGSSAVSQAAETLGRYANWSTEQMRDRYGPYMDQAREQYEHAQDLVRHNPASSVAMAFGIGIVAGVVVGLALRSR